MTDTTPKRLRELAGRLWVTATSDDRVAAHHLLLALAAEKEAQHQHEQHLEMVADLKQQKPELSMSMFASKEDYKKAVEAQPSPADEFARGWNECMALWADHMKRMNDALAKPLPEGWANHAHHIERNVREALDAAPADVPMPEPTRKVVYNESKGYSFDADNAEKMHQFGQDCAKAARDAAFDECAKLLEGIQQELCATIPDIEFRDDVDEGEIRGFGRALGLVQAAKKGTT